MKEKKLTYTYPTQLQRNINSLSDEISRLQMD